MDGSLASSPDTVGVPGLRKEGWCGGDVGQMTGSRSPESTS